MTPSRSAELYSRTLWACSLHPAPSSSSFSSPFFFLQTLSSKLLWVFFVCVSVCTLGFYVFFFFFAKASQIVAGISSVKSRQSHLGIFPFGSHIGGRNANGPVVWLDLPHFWSLTPQAGISRSRNRKLWHCPHRLRALELTKRRAHKRLFLSLGELWQELNQGQDVGWLSDSIHPKVVDTSQPAAQTQQIISHVNPWTNNLKWFRHRVWQTWYEST